MTGLIFMAISLLLATSNAQQTPPNFPRATKKVVAACMGPPAVWLEEVDLSCYDTVVDNFGLSRMISITRITIGYSSNANVCEPSPADQGCRRDVTMLTSATLKNLKNRCTGQMECTVRNPQSSEFQPVMPCNYEASYIYYEYSCILNQGALEICQTQPQPSILNEGYIISPQYPVEYADNLRCQCTIAATPGQALRGIAAFIQDLHIDSQTTGYQPTCERDYLEVELRGGRKTRLCGDHLTGHSVLSVGGPLKLTFVTDMTDVSRGFWLKFAAIPTNTEVQVTCGVLAGPVVTGGQIPPNVEVPAHFTMKQLVSTMPTTAAPPAKPSSPKNIDRASLLAGILAIRNARMRVEQARAAHSKYLASTSMTSPMTPTVATITKATTIITTAPSTTQQRTNKQSTGTKPSTQGSTQPKTAGTNPSTQGSTQPKTIGTNPSTRGTSAIATQHTFNIPLTSIPRGSSSTAKPWLRPNHYPDSDPFWWKNYKSTTRPAEKQPSPVLNKGSPEEDKGTGVLMVTGIAGAAGAVFMIIVFVVLMIWWSKKKKSKKDVFDGNQLPADCNYPKNMLEFGPGLAVYPEDSLEKPKIPPRHLKGNSFGRSVSYIDPPVAGNNKPPVRSVSQYDAKYDDIESLKRHKTMFIDVHNGHLKLNDDYAAAYKDENYDYAVCGDEPIYEATIPVIEPKVYVPDPTLPPRGQGPVDDIPQRPVKRTGFEVYSNEEFGDGIYDNTEERLPPLPKR